MFFMFNAKISKIIQKSKFLRKNDTKLFDER